MASSFLYNALVGVLNNEFDSFQLDALKSITENKGRFMDNHVADEFGIILTEKDIKDLIEKDRQNFEGPDCLDKIFVTEDWNGPNGEYMMQNSFAFNLASGFAYDGFEFQRVCCKDEYVILTSDDSAGLSELYMRIKELLPGVEMRVLEKECSCT